MDKLTPVSDVAPHDYAMSSQSDTMASHQEHRRTESAATEPAYAEGGILIDRAPTHVDMKEMNDALFWPRWRKTIREPLSEFMGTFILIMFGDGVVAQVLLSGGLSTDPTTRLSNRGEYQSISWGWVSISRWSADWLQWLSSAQPS